MYLCNQYEKSEDYPRLYPVDPTARGKVDQMLFVSESLSDMIQSYLVSYFCYLNQYLLLD